MSLRALNTAQASQWFVELPRELQLASLSPEFAAADTARQDNLRCIHAAYEEGPLRWLNSMHLRPMAGSPAAMGAVSPYGYGGPLSNSEDASFLSRAWTAYREWCAAQGVLAEFCRFHPQAGNQRYFGGTATQNRMTVSVSLDEPDVSIQYSTLAKRKLRRASVRGAQVRWSSAPADWGLFAGFYREAMRAMGAPAWYLFSDSYFARLRELPQAWLCICEMDGSWASAGVYLLAQQVIEYHLGASSRAGREAGTAYLMQHAAAGRGQAVGAHSLYLGGGTSPEEENSLLFYKKSFSRRLLPFFIGQAIHDQEPYWALAAQVGYDRAHPPGRVLLD